MRVQIKKKLILICCVALMPLGAMATDAPSSSGFAGQIAELERINGGRIGVAVIDTGSGRQLGYRADERFAMCSTFKLLLASAVLSRVDIGAQSLEHQLTYGKTDMLHYAPVTQKHLSDGKMSIADLSAAAIEYSDNTAANLLLRSIGGPEALTHYLRSLGDTTTRLDRSEPELNTNVQEDIRDTTTPAAMVRTMRKLLTENALSPKSRQQLAEWLIGNTTGDTRLRAGFGAGWKVGDKTGTGDNGATNDIAIVWPPASKPLLIAVYYSGGHDPQEKRNAIIAAVGRITAHELQTGHTS